MIIRKISMLLLKSLRDPGPLAVFLLASVWGEMKWLWTLLTVLGVLCFGYSNAAATGILLKLEEPPEHLSDSPVLWKPPDSSRIITDEAQWGSPGAPFLFLGGVLHAGGSFRSDREFRIGEPALINVHANARLHVAGAIRNDGRSNAALIKLGAGDLKLSGENTYIGNTLLLQGGMDIARHGALAGYMLNANVGTRLSYAPGLTVFSALQLQQESIGELVPAGSYSVLAPAEYADSVQWTVESGKAAHAGLLMGSAPLVKQGAGLLQIAGDAFPYFGLATVNQGALAIDTFFAGSLRVNDGARLQGVGQAGSATVLPGGTLAPGNGIGTFTINHDLEFKSGAYFEVDVAAGGASDFVQVNGKALLDGHVMVLAESGGWKASTRYTLLRAEQGLENTRFASVATNLAFLTPSLSYDGNQAMLVLSRNEVPLAEVVHTPNQEKVAQVLDMTEADVPAPSLHEQVLRLDRPQARAAFDQMSGSWAASVQSSVLDDTRFLRQAVYHAASSDTGVPATASRLSPSGTAMGARGLMGQAGDVVGRPHAWVDPAKAWAYGFYSSADRAERFGVAADERALQGMVLGVSHRVSPAWSLGGFFGAQQSRLGRAHGMADARIDSAHAGLSASGRWQKARFVGAAAHTWHAARSRRTIQAGTMRDSLQSRYAAQSTQLWGELSMPLPLDGRPPSSGARTVAEPFVRAAWVHITTPGFVEQGGDAALDVRGRRRSQLFSIVGLKLSHTVLTKTGAARMHGLAAWRYVGGAVRSFGRQSFASDRNHAVFESEGQPLARSAWQLELGVAARLAKQLDLSLGYAGQFAGGLQDHGLRLNLSYAF